MALSEYKIGIERNNIDRGEKPVSVYVSTINIDPNGLEIFDTHGKTVRACLRRALDFIELDEKQRDA